MSVVPLRVPKTAELVAAQLRRRIVEGDLLEGDALPAEAELREAFGISRPTLREAYRVLESEGLIEVHRGARGGARVRVPSDDAAARYAGLVLEHRRATLADICAVRAIIEPACAATIADRGDPADIERLRQAMVHAEGSARAQVDFHVELVTVAGNQSLALMHAMVQRIIQLAMGRRVNANDEAEAVHEGARAHRRLLEVLATGDGERAARLWRRHLDETTAYLLSDGRSTMVLDLLP